MYIYRKMIPAFLHPPIPARGPPRLAAAAVPPPRGPPRPAAAAAAVVPPPGPLPLGPPRGPPRLLPPPGPPKCPKLQTALHVHFKGMKSHRIKPNLIARSIDVLEERENWKDQALKYNGGEFEHVYAFDCEMVYACKRNFFDNRPPPSVSLIHLQTYNEAHIDKKKMYRGKKHPDEAISVVEFYGRDDFNNGIDKEEWTEAHLPNAKTFLNTKELVKVLAQIVITDWCGHVIYEKYVQPDTEVIWTAKQYSGIPQGFFTPGDPMYHRTIPLNPLVPDEDFATLEEVCMCLDSLFIHDDSKIVGHGIIKGDFPCMDYPIDDPKKFCKIRDTGEYYKNNTDDNPEGCALLCENLLNKEIQIADGGHDPSEDARGALALYKLDYENWENNKEPRCAIVDMAKIMLLEPFQLPQPFQQPPGLNLPQSILDKSEAILPEAELNLLFTRDTYALMYAALKLVKKGTPIYYQLTRKRYELFNM